MKIKPMDPIGEKEQKAIDRATSLGGRVNHLPSGRVSIEYRYRGEIHDYESREDFIEDFQLRYTEFVDMEIRDMPRQENLFPEVGRVTNEGEPRP